MTRRLHRDDPEMLRTGTDDLPIFQQSIEAGKASLAATAAKNERDIERLIPLATELARKVGRHGITVSDLRIIGVQRGLLTGQETGRRLSYLGAVMQRAGLRPTGEWRRSSVVRSHGNLNQVYVLP